MALVIEDGSQPAGADSYATLAELAAYASARGFSSLPAADADKEVLLRKACDFLDSLESRFKGARVADDQPLAWPRAGVYLFSSETLFADDEIPAQIKNAQCQLACDGVATVLQPNGTGREVIRQKVDVIETEYAKSGSGTVTPEFNKAMAILGPTLKGNSFAVETVRV